MLTRAAGSHPSKSGDATRWPSSGWEPDALTAHVRIYEGATSIVHGSNIVTPPEETGGKQGKQTVS